MQAKSDRNTQIVADYSSGRRSLGELAAEYGVSRQTIHRIVGRSRIDGSRVRGDRDAARRDESSSERLDQARQAVANSPGMTREELSQSLGISQVPSAVLAVVSGSLRSHRPRSDLYAHGDYITALKAAAAGLGVDDLLTKKSYDEDRSSGEPSGAAVVLFFGSWNEGLKAAGLGTNGRFRYGSHFADATLIGFVKDYIDATGSTSRPGYTKWRAGNRDLASAGLITSRFEMWSEAVRQAVSP